MAKHDHSGGSVFVFKYWYTQVSDAVKFNMADRVHRLSLAASPLLVRRHIEFGGRVRKSLVSRCSSVCEIAALTTDDQTCMAAILE